MSKTPSDNAILDKRDSQKWAKMAQNRKNPVFLIFDPIFAHDASADLLSDIDDDRSYVTYARMARGRGESELGSLSPRFRFCFGGWGEETVIFIIDPFSPFFRLLG